MKVSGRWSLRAAPIAPDNWLRLAEKVLLSPTLIFHRLIPTGMEPEKEFASKPSHFMNSKQKAAGIVPDRPFQSNRSVSMFAMLATASGTEPLGASLTMPRNDTKWHNSAQKGVEEINFCFWTGRSLSYRIPRFYHSSVIFGAFSLKSSHFMMIFVALFLSCGLFRGVVMVVFNSDAPKADKKETLANVHVNLGSPYQPRIGRTPRGSCNNTLLRRVLGRFFASKCFLEGFL